VAEGETFEGESKLAKKTKIRHTNTLRYRNEGNPAEDSPSDEYSEDIPEKGPPL
jgi:hypothetical protein